MQAIEITEPGGPDVLQLTTRPDPAPGPGEVLIEVAAAGVNRPDVVQRQGRYAPPPGASDIPGLELAGTVIAVGEGVPESRIGIKVCALVTGGGYAEKCVAPVNQCLPIPGDLSMIEAAALPETWFTVWSNLVHRARLAAGETILIHGGTSGIGMAATKLAKWRGCTVITTQGNAEKCAASVACGADHALNYKDTDFVESVLEITGKAGANVILDMVGGDYMARNLKSLAVEGRLVQIAFLQGSKNEIDFMPLMLKRQTITGSTLRARPIADKEEIAADLAQHIWPEIKAGRIKPVIDSVFPLKDASKAHALMDSSTHIGKIVLDIAGDA